MITDRMKELLRLTAADLRQGIAPLGGGFLSDNQITLDEAYNLADLIALGVDSLLELSKTTAGQKLIAVATAETAMAETLKG